MVSRRVFLGGAFAGVAQAAFGGAPEVSSRPLVRPPSIGLRRLPSGAELIERAALGGRVSYVVADSRTGEVLEHIRPLLGMPPASVAKAITTAYGLDRLGPGYRFRTRLMADGAMNNGRLEGDLWLVGGGDPVLDTDNLSEMATALRAAGLREISGRFRIAAGVLPHVHEIDPTQPVEAGYNPAVSGLNLNFNRVHFEWVREQGAYTVRMDARSERVRPPVAGAHMEIVDRGAPVYTYDDGDEREEWTVARSALGNGGARWLPVRQPHLYAAEVFQVLARSHGIVLRGPDVGEAPPDTARVMVEHSSPPLEDVLRGMMRWSTNLTAEAVGLMASQAGGAAPDSLEASAREMSAWAQDRLEARRPRFMDHSGLGADSRISAHDMAHALVRAGANGALRQLMKDIPMRDAQGNPVPDHPVQVVAKTGTLNFVSCLAGYARAPSGRDLAFAVFCADLERRASLDPNQAERPPGGRSYTRRAKTLQQQLIERWAEAYA